LGNVATSIEIQIQILKNRGMIIDIPEAKVCEVLLDIGYYRLGFYWHPYQMNKSHQFKVGTKFSNVLALYYLDVDLRHTLHKYLNRIEVNFRTKLVYAVSNHYPNCPNWFSESSIVKTTFLNNLAKIYNEKFKSRNRVIKLHHAKYLHHNFAPAWKTLEYFTFGTNLNLYRNIINEDVKKQISLTYQIENTKKFQVIIGAMLELRNACAHGDVLFDFNLPLGVPNFSVFQLSGSDRQSIFACYQVLRFLLSSISMNRKNQLDSEVHALLHAYRGNTAINNIITNNMKFRIEM
jgi:abortive infection bacteriophage resistance protein